MLFRSFSYEQLDQVASAYKKLKNKILKLEKEGDVDKAIVKAHHDKFAEAVGNDVNTAMGITLLYDVLKEDLNGATKRAIIEDYDYVLSLDLLKEPENEAAADVDPGRVKYIEAKIEERKAAKKEKDFAKADAIRDELLSKGITIKDTREGVVWSI